MTVEDAAAIAAPVVEAVQGFFSLFFFFMAGVSAEDAATGDAPVVEAVQGLGFWV